MASFLSLIFGAAIDAESHRAAYQTFSSTCHIMWHNQQKSKCITVNPMRPEIMGVGANDPYIRLYDRRMIRQNPKSSSTIIPQEAATYYVAGHLPQKRLNGRKKFKSLACTYVAFSPDGSEMLSNLGGEQIYLFDVFKPNPPKSFCINFNSNGFAKSSLVSSGSNGYSKSRSKDPPEQPSNPTPNLKLPSCVEDLKLAANVKFEDKEFTKAINIYNVAINLYPRGAVLYGNRAAAFVKRGWDGDLYAALRDCYTALNLEHEYLKVHYKLVKVLLDLKWVKEAASALDSFKIKYPDHLKRETYLSLEKDLEELKIETKSSSSCLKRRRTSSSNHLSRDSDSESSSEVAEVQDIPFDILGSRLMNEGSDDEKVWRARANDYKYRFCGHCNTTTDIKEANFFGPNGQFVVAGSDDGSFFVWDKKTCNIVRVMKGDDSIVNCLQPHPSICLLASSGIDSVVRLWSPRPEVFFRTDVQNIVVNLV